MLFLFVRSQARRARQADLDSVLEKIAVEYFERRQMGETMSQIRAALYRHYSITEPVELEMGSFNPVPFGNFMLIDYVRAMPEDALGLGEIAYSISCHREIYPPPSEDPGIRNRMREYDAMARMCSTCRGEVFFWDGTGKKVDPSLRQMLRDWSVLDSKISAWEKEWEDSTREPERPEMLDKAVGVNPSEGLFGTSWHMPMEQVIQIAPKAEERKPDSFCHFGMYRARKQRWRCVQRCRADSIFPCTCSADAFRPRAVLP